MAEEVGAVFVSLVPSARGFSAAARRELAGELRGFDVTIPITPEVDRAAVTRALTGATAGQRGALPIATDVDATQLLRETRGAVREVEATRPTVTVHTDVDRNSFRRALTGLSADADRGGAGLARSLAGGFGGGLIDPKIGLIAALIGVLTVPGAALTAAATLLGVSLAGIFLGAFALRGNKELRAAVGGLLGEIDAGLTKAAQPLVKPFLEAIGILRDTAKVLAPDLRELFSAVAPYIPILAEGVSGFLKAFTPDLVEAVKASAPVIEQFAMALPDIGDALGQFLTSMALVAPEAAAFLGSLLRFTADAIRALGGLIGFLTSVSDSFIGLIKGIGEFFREAVVGWGYILRVIGGDTELLKQMMRGAADYIAHWWGKLWGIDLPAGASRGVSNVLGQARALPGKIVSALGNVGNLLYQAGRNILQGLIDGIRSKMPSLSGIMGDAASLARSFWPFSPAKQGPLSGRGSLFYAGQNLVGDLTEGMSRQLPQVSSASDQLAGAVGVGARGGAGTAATGGTLSWAPGSTGDRLLDAIRDLIQIRYGGDVSVALGAG